MSRSRPSRWSRGYIIALGALLCLNNLLPYVGLRDDSCQTMFSGLRWSDEGNNHHIAPQHMLSDLWDYYTDVHAELDPPAPEHGRAEGLERWLNQEERELNTEAVRAVVRQLCDRGHRVSLRYRLRERTFRSDDACREPRLSEPHAWIPIRLFDSHIALRPES